MSGANLADFLGYWEKEGDSYARHGDYDWMASLVPGQRVLEIGCGPGFGSQALARRGLSVLIVDSIQACLDMAAQRLDAEHAVSCLLADVSALDAAQRSQLEAFAPDTVVCWLMGAPASVSGAAAGDAGAGVVAYREKVHRAVAELAAALPTVRALHLVDRTAIPWQAKDIGRDTLVRYHLDKTLAGLPFSADRKNALYRKLGENLSDLGQLRKPHPALKSVVPTLASLLAERKA